MIRERAASFAMVAAIAFLLLVSLVISALLAAFNDLLSAWAGGLGVVLEIVNVAVSFFVVTLLFSMIYKILPDVRIGWRDVWVGAAVTALFFTLGKSLIGWYIGSSGAASTYGAAGSLVLILLWVYYSAQILFFGAEFTR